LEFAQRINDNASSFGQRVLELIGPTALVTLFGKVSWFLLLIFASMVRSGQAQEGVLTMTPFLTKVQTADFPDGFLPTITT